MPKGIDISGRRSGRLVALHRLDEKCGNNYRWLCRCDCGSEVAVSSANLGRVTNSCGCLKREVLSAKKGVPRTHGQTGTAEHRAWVSMRQRCSDPRCAAYANYGGRGIRICIRWASFENFIADMGPRPSAQHSLDRVDVNGDYGPDNCRWATQAEQGRNRRPRSEWRAGGRGAAPAGSLGLYAMNGKVIAALGFGC